MSLKLETYPASKRSEIFELMHESQNWTSIEHEGWHLPAIDEPKDDCGKWFTKGCPYVTNHSNSEFAGMIFIKTFQKSCYRASCQICFKKWMARDSNKATRRIEKYERLSGKPSKHIIISVPSWKYEIPIKEMRKEAYNVLKSVNAIGGSLIFHPFRYNKENKQWYYSPHFHCIGFGWISNTEEIYNKHGWIVKNKGTRDSIFATFYYQLSHAGVKHGYHTITWFGDLSYSKLKVEEDPYSDKCPVCQSKLKLLFHYGLYGYTPPPETEVEMWVEPEGWRILNSNPFYANPVSNCLAIYRKNKPEYDMI